MRWAQSIVRREKNHYLQLDPQTAARGNNFHRILLLFQTHAQLPMRVSRRERKPKPSDLGFGRKRHNLIRGKCFFAAKCLVSGDGRRITHWRIVPLRYRVRHARTLDSKIAKGIMNVLPAVFKRKINFLEDAQYKN